ITSVLFAIMHGQWNVGVNVFAMSIVLCLLREMNGTIYSGILLHILKNGVAFVLLYILNIGF
ncbi:CPBP family intramembrane metalloprotease, partial [Candidatus Saccharibacteria bacterium]|nr:CPBP family intramembrane metalloprotease [Candidatus Saccharibacteria bacterium]